MGMFSSDNHFDRISSVIEGSDTCWKRLMKGGHLFFQEQQFEEAGKYYEVALNEAQDIFLSAQIGTVYCDICPASLLIPSAISLADSQNRQGKGDQAVETLSTAIERLSIAISDPGSPQAFSEKCAYHLGSALIRLTTLMRNLGASQDKISAVLDRSQTAFLLFAKRDGTLKH